MYRAAEQEINKGLSLSARLILGFFAGLFGVVTIFTALPGEKVVFSYMFGGFCLLISIACVTSGRVRQVVGSVIGSALLILSLAYFASEALGGTFWSGSRSQPSLVNAALFLLAFGLPGATYAYRARFGFGHVPQHDASADRATRGG